MEDPGVLAASRNSAAGGALLLQEVSGKRPWFPGGEANLVFLLLSDSDAVP